jgi:hypothetical protein
LRAYLASAASLGCMSLVLLSLYERGAEDWPNSFALFWFGLWGTAIVLALIVAAMGIGMRSLALGWRVVAVALASATLLASLILL